jgi:hypothetical protein
VVRLLSLGIAAGRGPHFPDELTIQPCGSRSRWCPRKSLFPSVRRSGTIPVGPHICMLDGFGAFVAEQFGRRMAVDERSPATTVRGVANRATRLAARPISAVPAFPIDVMVGDRSVAVLRFSKAKQHYVLSSLESMWATAVGGSR